MNTPRKTTTPPPTWPYDFTASRPTDIGPRAILRANRGPRVSAWIALARAVVYVLFALVPAAIVVLLVLVAANRAHAHDARAWLTVSVASYHPDRDYARERELAWWNPGLGLEFAVREDLRLVTGGYRNSYRRASFYAAAAWQPLALGAVRMGALAGAVNGYPIHDGRVGPFVGLVASVSVDRVGLNLVALPKVRDKAHGAIAVQLKWAL